MIQFDVEQITVLHTRSQFHKYIVHAQYTKATAYRAIFVHTPVQLQQVSHFNMETCRYVQCDKYVKYKTIKTIETQEHSAIMPECCIE